MPTIQQLVARVAEVLGGATGCKDIAPARIKAMTDKIMAVGIGAATGREEFAVLIQSFDQNEAEGRKAIAAGKTNCKAIETDLTELERAIAPAPGIPSANETTSQPSRVAVAPPPSASVNTVLSRGITDREIRLGTILPLSGPNKEAGLQTRIGIQAALNVANDAGGISGRRLTLFAADDAYDNTKTPDALKQLYDNDQIFALVGCYGTAPALVSVPFVLERRILFFAPVTGAGVVRQDPPDRYVFNLRASYAEEADAAVRYLVKIRRLKPEQIAVFAQQDGYGDSGFAGVAKAFRNLKGGEGSAILRLNYKRNTIDVDDAIAQLKKVPPGAIKAIVMIATYRAAARFIEKTRDLFPAMIYTNTGGVGATAFANELALLGPRYLTGNIVTQYVPSVEGSSSVVLRYKTALAKYFPGDAADAVSFESFLATNVLLEAFRRAGPQLDTEKVVDALEGMRDLDLGLGSTLSFGQAEHQALHRVYGTSLREDGKYEPVDLQ